MQKFVMTGAAKQDSSGANEYKKIISLPAKAKKVKKKTGFKRRLDILTSTVSIRSSGQPLELLSLSISL